ncbi:MAG: hypothetical protein IPJ13_29180 [Saprospiraceae bacterium]|nr:hypothetical protein [Saprospiraceae bacterium]
MAVISITDSEKFAQKVFAPDINDDETNRSTYQIITGITKKINKESTFRLSDTLDFLTAENWDKSNPREGKFKYALFINLCINKGLLIGSGTKLENQFCKAIDSKIRSRLNLGYDITKVTNRYLLSKSYSWFDLSIVVFSDDPNELIDALLDIRNIKFKDLNRFE